jgi:adenylate cyclase
VGANRVGGDIVIYRFSGCELDTPLFELRRGGEVVGLEPQEFAVLLYLIEHRDRVVTRDEIFEALWPGKVVSDGTLSARIRTVRKAVGDSGRAQTIVATVHGRGYRFAAQVVEELDPPPPPPAKVDALPRGRAPLLYAEVHGYSGLTSLLEEGTHRTLDCYLSALSAQVVEHRGEVQHYTGDVLLATFTEPTDALRCAVATQRSLAERSLAILPERRVEFRIGISTGEVIVRQGEIFGEEINVAAGLGRFAASGGICVSERVRDEIDPALGIEVRYLGERRLRNVGHRIGAYRIDVGTFGASTSVPSARQNAVLAARLERPQNPSLAVLPFHDLGEAGMSPGFAEGLTLELMTGLVKLSGLFLASDFSTFAYRDRHPSVQQVADALGVRYVLEGTVSRDHGRVRVHAKLSDVVEARTVWAKRIDRVLDDTFAAQDEIAEAVVTALDVKLVTGEAARLYRHSLGNAEALERFYAGWAALLGDTSQDMLNAQQAFEDAGALVPDSPLPPAMAAWAYWWSAFRLLAQDPRAAFALAKDHAEKAVRLDDTTGFPHLVMAHIHLSERDHELALRASRHAVKFRPSCDAGQAALANVLNYLGRPGEAVIHAQQALRLTPIVPTIYPAILSTAFCEAGRYQEAVDAAHATLDLNRDSVDAWLALAVAEVGLGNAAVARKAGREVFGLRPDFSLERYLETQPYADPNRLTRLAERLDVAGLSEPASQIV